MKIMKRNLVFDMFNVCKSDQWMKSREDALVTKLSLITADEFVFFHCHVIFSCFRCHSFLIFCYSFVIFFHFLKTKSTHSAIVISDCCLRCVHLFWWHFWNHFIYFYFIEYKIFFVFEKKNIFQNWFHIKLKN